MWYKIQKIYVGDKLVWPKGWDWIYYDFTTVSSIPSEFSVWKWSVSVSSGLRTYNSSSVITMNIGDISSKSSVRIEITGTRTSGSWAWHNAIWLTDRSGSSSSDDYAWYHTYELRKWWGQNATYSADYNGIKYEWNNNSKTNLTALTTSSSIWDYDLYVEFDLTTGLISGWGTTPVAWSTNYTLSSSQLTQLKAMQYFLFYTFPASSTADTLKTLKITIS